jgi:hypothetical protein
MVFIQALPSGASVAILSRAASSEPLNKKIRASNKMLVREIMGVFRGG